MGSHVRNPGASDGWEGGGGCESCTGMSVDKGGGGGGHRRNDKRCDDMKRTSTAAEGCASDWGVGAED